jgi:hypothetical protein
MGELVKVGDGLPECSNGLLLVCGSFVIWNNLDGERVDGRPAKNNLRCEPCAEVVISWEGDFRKRFEDRALSGRLISADDELRKRQDTFEPGFTKLVDNV